MKFLFISFILFFTATINAAEIDFTALNQTAKDHLVNLIDIDTAQPEPSEIKAVRYIYKVLNKNKIDWEIYRT